MLYPDEGSCIMEDIVYCIAYCMVAGCNNFYIGHTICRLRDRCSGHRGSFKPGCYKKSALAYHIFNHPEFLSWGLNNFAFGVLKQVDPRFLADAENLFIVQFKADTKHLNRNKALRFD